MLSVYITKESKSFYFVLHTQVAEKINCYANDGDTVMPIVVFTYVCISNALHFNSSCVSLFCTFEGVGNLQSDSRLFLTSKGETCKPGQAL